MVPKATRDTHRRQIKTILFIGILTYKFFTQTQFSQKNSIPRLALSLLSGTLSLNSVTSTGWFLSLLLLAMLQELLHRHALIRRSAITMVDPRVKVICVDVSSTQFVPICEERLRVVELQARTLRVFKHMS